MIWGAGADLMDAWRLGGRCTKEQVMKLSRVFVVLVGVIVAGCSGGFPGSGGASSDNGARSRVVREGTSVQGESSDPVQRESEEASLGEQEQMDAGEYAGDIYVDEVLPVEEEYESAGFESETYEEY